MFVYGVGNEESKDILDRATIGFNVGSNWIFKCRNGGKSYGQGT